MRRNMKQVGKMTEDGNHEINDQDFLLNIESHSLCTLSYLLLFLENIKLSRVVPCKC